MEEIVPIVDATNNIVKLERRSIMRKERLPHRATYVVLRNSAEQYYIEVRTMTKDYCPGMLDACIGGVVQAGEDDIYKSATRELKEEMGVDVPLEDLGWYKIEGHGSFIFAGLFFAEYDGQYVMQASEVSDVLMLTEEHIWARKDEFTPDSLVALKEILRRHKRSS